MNAMDHLKNHAFHSAEILLCWKIGRNRRLKKSKSMYIVYYIMKYYFVGNLVEIGT